MTIRTKILVVLCFIASAGMSYDLYLGMLKDTSSYPEIAGKTIIVVVCLWYAIRNLAGKKRDMNNP